jgi:hypothetical protein
MKIALQTIKVRDLVDGYTHSPEGSAEGVKGYGGKLDIRPPYQREFVYSVEKQQKVIESILRDWPLNVLYWMHRDDGNFEMIDGQQRTLSICEFVDGNLPLHGNADFFKNLQADIREKIMDYKLSVYVCEGTDTERLEWFNVINIAGDKLTPQEILNANYTGTWLTDAKRWFSKSGAPAVQTGEKLVKGSPIRQEILETALKWISARDFGKQDIAAYMSTHQHDSDAQELWQYWQEVFAWVARVFPETRSLMKGLPWGDFYNAHKDDKLNAAELEKRIVELIEDDEVDSKKGIYEYLLTGNTKTLSLRAFDEKTQVKQYEKQKGVCPKCKKHYELTEMEADHIIPWSKGGKTTPENCQMLCKMDNRTKSGI